MFEVGQASVQKSMLIYFITKWEPEPIKKPASEFQRKHIQVYKADVRSSMEENYAHNRVWVGTAPVTQ